MAAANPAQDGQGSLASFLKGWLAEHNLSIRELAIKAGVDRTVLSEATRGGRVTVTTLCKLADSMELPRARLFVEARLLEAPPEGQLLTSDEQQLLQAWSQLEPEGRALVDSAIRLALRHRRRQP